MVHPLSCRLWPSKTWTKARSSLRRRSCTNQGTHVGLYTQPTIRIQSSMNRKHQFRRHNRPSMSSTYHSRDLSNKHRTIKSKPKLKNPKTRMKRQHQSEIQSRLNLSSEPKRQMWFHSRESSGERQSSQHQPIRQSQNQTSQRTFRLKSQVAAMSL